MLRVKKQSNFALVFIAPKLRKQPKIPLIFLVLLGLKKHPKGIQNLFVGALRYREILEKATENSVDIFGIAWLQKASQRY